MECRNLKIVHFAEGLEKIGNQVFARSGIESLETPSSLKVISPGAFIECHSLRRVVLADVMEVLGDAKDFDEQCKLGGLF